MFDAKKYKQKWDGIENSGGDPHIYGYLVDEKVAPNKSREKTSLNINCRIFVQWQICMKKKMNLKS